MRGSRGRRRGRRKSKAARSKRSSASSSSSSKSSKSKSKRRSTAASKRRKVRSVAKAARAANRAAKSSTSTSSSTSSSKNKTKRKVNKLKLNKRDRQKLAGENVKKAFKKKNEQKKTISASQSRKQVRQRTKEKIATRKKINMPSLGQIGRTLRNIRQPMSMLSDAGVRGFLGNPARAVAQGLVNSPHASDFNKRTRDFSQMTPQQRRKFERLSNITGRDYSVRNPTFRINMGLDTIAKFGGFADNKVYRSLPKSIRSLKVDKQFYGNPMKKGWHSSQRTGRGQGLTDRQRIQPTQGENMLPIGAQLATKLAGGISPARRSRLKRPPRGLGWNFGMFKPDILLPNPDQRGPIGAYPLPYNPPRRGQDQFGPGMPGRPKPLPISGPVPDSRPVHFAPPPPPDTIERMYQNILGRKADQEGLKYWKDQLSGGQSLDDIRKNFVRSKEFQGRSDADKRSALRGIKRRRAARGQKVGVSGIREQLDKRGIKHSKTGSRRGTFAGRPVRGTHARRRTRSINTGSRVAKGNRRRVNSLAKHVGLTAGLGL